MGNDTRQRMVWEHFCSLVGREDLPSAREMTLEEELVHAAGTARLAQLIAAKRNLDLETAFVLGVLHDYGRIITGIKKDHARIGSSFVREYLTGSGNFTPEEIETIVKAVANHSLKGEVGNPLEELIKDADVLEGFFAGRPSQKQEAQARLKAVLTELNVPFWRGKKV